PGVKRRPGSPSCAASCASRSTRRSMIPYGGEGLRGEPQDFRIPRTGDRDLAFRGWLLSHAEERGGSPGLTRGVDIDIYLTIRLRLVAHLCRWSLREGEGLREEHRVAAHDSAAKLDRKSTRLNSSH